MRTDAKVQHMKNILHARNKTGLEKVGNLLTMLPVRCVQTNGAAPKRLEK